MRSKTMKYVKPQVRASTKPLILDVICSQVEIHDHAENRIKEEGIVVRDIKGSVIPHPAIKIQIDAGKIIAELISKNR